MHTQDKLVFESCVSGGGQSVLLTCGDGGANIVHLQTGGGTRLEDPVFVSLLDDQWVIIR